MPTSICRPTNAAARRSSTIADGALAVPRRVRAARSGAAAVQRAARLAHRCGIEARRAAARRAAGEERALRQRRCRGRAERARGAPAPGAGLARGGRFPGQLDLSASSTAHAPRPPRATCRSASRSRRAATSSARCKAGSLGNATFRVKGDLWDFPFYATPQAGRVPHRRQLNDVTLRLRAERAERQRRAGVGLAVARPDERQRRTGVRPHVDGDPQRAGAALAASSCRRSTATSPTWSTARCWPSTATAAVRWPTCCASSTARRSATGPAARLHRPAATGAADLKLALRIPLADVDRSTRQGQRRAGRQRRAHQARHAAARRRARSGRVHAARLCDRRRRGARARRRRHVRRRHPARRLAALQWRRAWPPPKACAAPPRCRCWPALAVSLSGQTPYRVTLGIVARRHRDQRHQQSRRHGQRPAGAAGQERRGCAAAALPDHAGRRRQHCATRCASSSAPWCRRSSCATCRATRRACCAAASASATRCRSRPPGVHAQRQRRRRSMPMPGRRTAAALFGGAAARHAATAPAATRRRTSRCARTRSSPRAGA